MEHPTTLDQCKGYLIVGAVRLLAFLPLPLAQWIGAAIGWVHWRIRSRTAQVTFTNLELCMPGMDPKARDQLARASLMQTGRGLMETPGVWLSDNPRNLARIVRVEGEELLQQTMREGKGLVLLLPHLGNWELVNAYLGAGPRMTALYQPPELPPVRRLIESVRARCGNELVAPTRAGLARLFRVLEGGGIVTVLPDQVPASGVFAPFFGEEALTDLLIPRLVRRTGAAVLCLFVRRLPRARGFEIVFRPAQPGIGDADPRAAATALNASIESCVREAPDQYQWEYRRFKKRPQGLPRLYHRRARRG